MSIPAPERRAKADARRARASRTREAAPSRHFMALAAIGSAKPSTPQAWRDAVTECADGEALRADARATALSIARALAWASERGTLIVRRLTWDRLAGEPRSSPTPSFSSRCSGDIGSTCTTDVYIGYALCDTCVAIMAPSVLAGDLKEGAATALR